MLSGWTLHDFRDGRIDYVYAEKTTGGRRVPVVRGSADVASVSTSQATVAWDSTLHEKSDICGFNLTSRRPFVVCDAPGRQIGPPIDGDVVVWKDGRDGGSDIRGANIVTSKEFVVSNAPGGQWLPEVSGDIVVWADARNGATADIWGKNLATGVEFLIAHTSNTKYAYPVDISGDLVVWKDKNSIRAMRLKPEWVAANQDYASSLATL